LSTCPVGLIYKQAGVSIKYEIQYI